MSAHIIEKTQSAYHFPLLIRSLFRSAMSLDTSEEIVQHGAVRRSYREFGERVHRLASALADIGVTAG
jgi:fatty-acyl-CoA synthase